MIELFFLVIFGFGALYALYYWFNSMFQKEKDFANDVYHYLSRRYKNTTIVDSGGAISDPIIISRDAGPFKLIEVKVVTEKHASATDQDLIIRGEVDPQKFQAGQIKPANLFLYLKSRGHRYSHDITIGDAKFDRRFIINSEDPRFARHLLAQTNLRNHFTQDFDLEGYSIRWFRDNSPVIQVRMETMSLPTFIRGFSILLGTIGNLAEKGYLIRGTGDRQEAVKIPTYRPRKGLKEIPSYKDTSIAYSSSTKEFPVINEDIGFDEELTESDFDEAVIDLKNSSKDEIPMIKSARMEVPKKDSIVEEQRRDLFSSIRYQVKELMFKPEKVIIQTFSSSTSDIVVTFLDNNRVRFTTLIERPPKSNFEIQVNFIKDPQSASWSDVWKDIEITGPPEIIDNLKSRNMIANRIAMTGHIAFNASGTVEQGIKCEITVLKTKETISAGYSLLKDFIWFFEMMNI